MSSREEEFLKRLWATFRIEVDDHLQAMSAGLLELEKTADAQKQKEIIEAVFREAHSLKGAARAVNSAEIEAVSASLESVFAALKGNEIALSPALYDLLHQGLDSIRQFLSNNEMEGSKSVKPKTNELMALLQRAAKGEALPEAKPLPASPVDRSAAQAEETAETPAPTDAVTSVWGQPERAETSTSEAIASTGMTETAALAETVRISTARLDALLPQVEEMLSAKLALGQRAAELSEINVALASWKKQWSKIPPVLRKVHPLVERKTNGNSSTEATEYLPTLTEFLEWNAAFHQSLEAKLAALTKAVRHDHYALSKQVDGLLGDAKKMLMLPFSSLLTGFPKLVRDLARDRGKEVELVIEGAEIEIDRRILHEIKDPLIHLVRNAVDHGIENPDKRQARNKPLRARLRIAISSEEGGKVEVLVSDDGAGIDFAAVRAAALKSGRFAKEELQALSAQETLSLIFDSGVSTSPIITDLSGRGLGLAIVREKVEKLGGGVAIETQPEAGTVFRLHLPITLATFRGVLIRLGDRTFVVPTTNVERVARIPLDNIKTVENKETIQLDEETISFARLQEVLELPGNGRRAENAAFIPVMILSSAGKHMAFGVDEILNEQEVLAKSLGKQLLSVRNLAGATVLGSGQVAPILDVADMMNVAARAVTKSLAAPVEESEAKQGAILVVDDSITTRALLKNILESAGYRTSTAVDGIDAFTQLKTETFDLVVSDIEMPRMNGFDLTEKIRADKQLAEMPVVLVTALETREDRERGIDAGANAYIVKSSFDQSNLLEVIQRLL
ncbi:MAG: hybrid sensor histidine kinase/response regulator [Acidobacteriota bacterium]